MKDKENKRKRRKDSVEILTMMMKMVEVVHLIIMELPCKKDKEPLFEEEFFVKNFMLILINIFFSYFELLDYALFSFQKIKNVSYRIFVTFKIVFCP